MIYCSVLHYVEVYCVLLSRLLSCSIVCCVVIWCVAKCLREALPVKRLCGCGLSRGWRWRWSVRQRNRLQQEDWGGKSKVKKKGEELGQQMRSFNEKNKT